MVQRFNMKLFAINPAPPDTRKPPAPRKSSNRKSSKGHSSKPSNNGGSHMATTKGAVKKAVAVARPAIMVAGGNIVGTKATDAAVDAALGSQSAQTRKIAKALLPFGLATFIIGASKKADVKQFGIGVALTGVENTLAVLMPAAQSAMGAPVVRRVGAVPAYPQRLAPAPQRLLPQRTSSPVRQASRHTASKRV